MQMSTFVNEGGVNTDQNTKLGGHETLVLASYSVSSSNKVANIYKAENSLLIAQDKQPCVKCALLQSGTSPSSLLSPPSFLPRVDIDFLLMI